MNKKMLIIIAVAIIALLVLLLGFGGRKESAPSETAAPEVVSAENTEKSAAEVVPADETVEEAAEEANKAEETEKPAVTDGHMTDTFIKESTNVGVAQGGGTQNVEEGGDAVSAPQVNVPAEDNSSDEPVTLTVDIVDIGYEMYLAMSAAEQQAVVDSFGSMEDFMVWLNYIKAVYEAEHPSIEIGSDGTVDLS